MRFAASPLALLCAFTVTLAWGATLTLPTFNSCAPANIGVAATGNYTIEGRDSTTNRLAFRAHVKKGVTRVTWDAVDLAVNDMAVITVTDQTGPSPAQTSVVSASGIVMANPTGNTTCLAKKDDDSTANKTKSIVPTVVGVVVGAFILLMLLLSGVALWRRKQKKTQRHEQEDSVDLSHAYLAQNGAPVPAGGSYMARLVPRLNLQEAKPLPRDKRLEDEHAHYASTRRGTQYYNSPQVGGEFSMVGGGEKKSQHESGAYYQNYPSVWQRPEQQQPNGHDPFASKNDSDAQSQHSVQRAAGSTQQDAFGSQPDLHAKSCPQQRGFPQDIFVSQHDLHAQSPEQQRGGGGFLQQDPFASQHDLQSRSPTQQRGGYAQQHDPQQQRGGGYPHEDPFALQHEFDSRSSPYQRGYSPSNFSD